MRKDDRKGRSVKGYVEEIKHIFSDRDQASQAAGKNVFPPPSKLLSGLQRRPDPTNCHLHLRLACDFLYVTQTILHERSMSSSKHGDSA